MAHTDGVIGQRVAHYDVVERIGSGGMGIVYKAQDARLGRSVALKFVSEELSGDRAALDRFAREARAASALNHPNICTIHDIGEHDGRSFIVMEYLDGTTLKDRLAAGPMDSTVVFEMAVQIADALESAHAAGIIHRDVKPANIFIGSRDRVKVLDFGLAKMRPSGQPDADVTTMAETRRGAVVGTAAYMAPEQAGADVVDHRADIWSFGVVLCEMATGKRPAPGVPMRVEAMPELERIISKCLEADRDRRYQHASELRADLIRLRSGHGVSMAPRPVAARRRALWLAAGAIVIAAAVAIPLYSRRPPPLTDTDTIVLAEFANATGDPMFDETLRQGLAVQLQQSPFLSLISEERIRRTLSLMNQPPDARLTPDIARDVCIRTGSTAILEGSIAALGSEYVLGLRARHCLTGDMLADDQAQAARKEDVLGALSQMAVRFRSRLGESLATVEKHSLPLREATTSSLEAWKAFATAMKLTNSLARRPHLLRAIEIDPEFAMAHAFLGFADSTMGESMLAARSLRRAYELRHRVSDAERFYIETLYDRDVTGNMEREHRTLEAWAQAYPRENTPHSLVAGLVGSSTGQHELSIAETDKALALEPDAVPTWNSRARHFLLLNRPDDASLAIRRAVDRKLDPNAFLLNQYFVAFLTDNDAERQRIADAARKTAGFEDMISHVEALRLARSGRLADARRIGAVPVEIARRSGRRERAGVFAAARAVWEAFYGNTAAAKQSAATALELGKGGREVDYAVAVALALCGDVPRARVLAEGLAREFPEDTSVQFMYLPALRALFSLNAGDASAALESLQAASRYDLALGRIGFTASFGGLFPVYVRGLAYLAADQPIRAAAEFQKIVDHPSRVLVDPMGAMARLQLARALTRSGETAKAKQIYGDLLTLWESADPKIPVVEGARAESARLR